MEAERLNANHQQGFIHRSLPAVIPVLLISIGYVDPGKWVATVEGGARFGFDLMPFMLIFNLAAIFCQYISARIGIVTGRDLAQICSNEYDTWTCMLLGVQAELSVIMLDLNMMLGMAQGLNLIFGWDLFTCVFLTATGAVFHLLLAVLLDIEKAKILGQYVAGFVLVLTVLGLLFNRPENPLSVNGIQIKLSGESSFVIMSLLGATLVPHNFYLHSSIVQWHQGPTNISKDALCHNHFWAILCVFSCLYLVNNAVMSTSANEFHSMGLFLLTFQDALSPMEQVLRSPVALFVIFLILFLANQTTALNWGFGGEVVVQSFLKLDIPGWLHYVTIRVIAVLPALYCVWSSGAEGLYQLLIFTQVLVALQLPSSVIPLFRVATSRSIMGAHKMSQFVELLALTIFIGMLGLNIVFSVEMMFGSSDWVGDWRWNAGSGVSFSYLFLLTFAFASLSLMVWLAATPLRSASVQLDAQAWNLYVPEAVPNPLVISKESYVAETRYDGDVGARLREPTPAPAKTLDYTDVPVASFHSALPETIVEPDLHVTAVRESQSITSFPSSPKALTKELAYTSESEAVSTVIDETSDFGMEDTEITKLESNAPIEKEVSEDLTAERDDDDDGDSWENEESSKVVSTGPLSTTSDGPPSFRSFSGKSDEGGNSIGSLSKLAGLGRAARRQLAAILDEFWGQLYDFHGQATAEARAKKLDVLIAVGSDSRHTGSMQKMGSFGKEYSDYSDSVPNSGPYDTSDQRRMQSSLESSYGIQRSSSLHANPMQLLDAYVQNSGRNLLDSGERRYSSVRNLPSSGDSGERRYSSLRNLPSSDDSGERRYSSVRNLPSSDDSGERRYSSVRNLPSSDDSGKRRYSSVRNMPSSDDSGERCYSSLRILPSSEARDYQPATIHGYQTASYLSRVGKGRNLDNLNGLMEVQQLKASSLSNTNYRDSVAYALAKRLHSNGAGLSQPPGFHNVTASRNSHLQSGRTYYDYSSSEPAVNMVDSANAKKYHSLPDISGYVIPHRDGYASNKNAPWEGSVGYGSSASRTSYEPSLYSNSESRRGAPLAFDELSPSKVYREALSSQLSSGFDAASLWSRQPFEQFGVADKIHNGGLEGVGSRPNNIPQESTAFVDIERKLLQSFRLCIVKLLKLEGSDWLFSQNDGVDEDLIDRVAAREKFVYEIETREMNLVNHVGEAPNFSADLKSGSSMKNNEANSSTLLVSSVPNCGEGCVWRSELIISFGVWCIHRILNFSLMESRPELWGKYTYVLNRLQGIIDPAFSKPRSSLVPCFCLQVPTSHQQKSSPPLSNGMMLPPTSKPGRGKCTTASTLLDLIKDVEIAISSRKGRTGTAAGDVAFPKGKENLASVLKRYKRRLSNKPIGTHEGTGLRKMPTSAPYNN
ncbi:Ethylene-insensitive protein 2 [Stylosanthes scabra]|uniref:Ethylene-insensitive protein 2 n=1 Tax=Stylosanthes scabra TaxID=79078 RepID=A0ABU6T545_9FABA|nr:Ethylene-insensitive protein 2 [Stylosanthes scabra]